MDSNKLDCIYITKIRATDVTGGHCQLAVECDGTITKTSIETVPLGNGVVEWDEQIPLPTDPSTNVLLKVYASFQKMALKLGNGKLIGRCEISVGELLDRNERLETIKFPASRDEETPSCSSLRITTERRACDSNDECLPHLHKSRTKRPLKELIGDGDAALLRFHQYKSQVDLDKAIACFGLARHRCPNDHPVRSAAQFSLANAMFVDCQANNYKLSLDVPVKLYQDTLRLRARGDADHAQATLQLCLALLVRFERRGNEADRREVMDLLARLMKISPADGNMGQAGRRILHIPKWPMSSRARDSRVSQVEDVDGGDLIHKAQVMLRTLSHQDCRRPDILYALGNLLRRRFQEKGNLADIHEAILMSEEAVQLVANGDSKKPKFLEDLGISLRIRFEQLGKTADLERSIFILEEALHLTPDDNSDKSSRLNSLGNVLVRRFERLGDLADITKSVSMFEQAICLIPDGHPHKPGRLNNLGNVLFRRFEQLGNLADITKSISMFEQAICHTPAGHPDKPAQLNNLGNVLSHRFQRLGDLADITKSISAFEQAVHLTPDDHPDKYGGLNSLGNALLSRFERLGDLADITKSISMFEQTVRLIPDDHPDKPGRLNNLGNALSRRFERFGDLADITKFVSIFEQAVCFTPDGHPVKPSLLNNMGNALSHRFQQLGDLADITKSVSMFEQAIRLTSDSHPVKPSLLNNMGNALSHRFRRLGDLADLTESVSMFEQSIRLTPDGHPVKRSLFNNLGNMLSRRFERLGELADITKSVSMFEQAIHLTPDDHPDKPSGLDSLGNALSRRFERLGDLTDIAKSVSMFEQAICLIPDGHPLKPSLLNNLGNVLSHRFQRLGDLTDITKLVSIFEQADHLTPDDHPDKPARLDGLGNALLRRFERFGDLADITKSVSMFEQAIPLAPDGHPAKRSLLNNLGSALSRRFQHLGDLADITKSASMFEQVTCLTPDGHPDKPRQLNNLGNVLLSRFQRLGDLTDITKSVSVFKQVVCLTADNHPDKPTVLNSLGHALLSHFERLGDPADVTKSVSIFEQAVHLTPDGHPHKPGQLNSLGNALSCRFEQFRDLADITKSVSVFEQAVCLTPDGHPDKPGRLNNLGNALLSRFEQLGDHADITKSVSMFEQATCLIPDGHPDKPTQLNNMGNALLSRFERLCDLVDITKSVSMFERAVCLTPDGHPDKPTRLNNLGNALSCRFEWLYDLADITKSVSMFEQAVCLTPDGHPVKPSLLHNLGNSFTSRFYSSDNSSDLIAATFHFSAAAQCSTGPTAVRFAAARRWISSTQLKGDSKTLIRAYTIALTLLPQLAWMGLPLTERHRVLVGAADVARGAAAAALDAGFLDMAVEWLEQGRSIVWTQFLQLRTSVDLLRVAHPALADDFEQTSKQLENASNRDHVLSAEVLRLDSWSQEEVVQKHHTLTLRREKLLADIRSLTDFDRFLLPQTIGQLAALVSSGPVVYLNASQRRCDALIVVPGRENVVHVPLCAVSYRHVERMHQLLVERDRLTVPVDDISLLTPSGERSATDREGGPVEVEDIPCDRFQLVLRFLWSNVVHPVLDALAFSTPPSQGEKIPRIFWCPTGPFAFLPIHAAGIYGASPAGPKLSDFVISSYIPTLSALAPSTGKAPRSPSNIRLLTVPQPPTDGQPHLWGVNGEIDTIKTLSGESQCVTTEDSDGTVEDVTQNMDCADWVHFACHGIQDPIHPLDSGLCLANGRRLRLSDIIKLYRQPGGLAFLSACQTAKGEEKLSEESVHLAAGMLLAGYDGVIATMWSIMDNDAPKVTRDVYKYLFRDGKVPDTMEAAEALHRAVVRLRDEDKVSFSSWVPFIHVGR